MKKASQILRAPQDAIDTITLDETARHRRRMKMVSDGGIEFMLDLPKARLLRHGEGLVLEDGRVIEVRAEPEDIYEIRAKDMHHLLQLAWQLGNRHLPTEVGPDTLRIRRDHVIKEMLIGLGAEVTGITAPFNPEGGAYDDPDASTVAHRHTHHTHHHD